MKRIGIILLVIMTVICISGCDNILEEEENGPYDYVFLKLEKSDQYGGEFINPAQAGNYAYSLGQEVEVKLEITEGYKFISWQGENGNELTDKKSNDNLRSGKIIMDGDKNIKAVFKLEDFLILNTKPKAGAKDVSFNELEEIILEFNNKLGIRNLPDIKVGKTNGESSIDFRGDIKENKIILEISQYPEFGEKYDVVFDGILWDENGRYLEGTADFNFTIEEDQYPPISPEDFAIDQDKNTVELTWERTRDQPQKMVDVFSKKYYIYRSQDNEEFTKIGEKVDEVYDIPEKGVIQISYIDQEVDLENTTYYYYITAVDEKGNESKHSVVRGTE